MTILITGGLGMIGTALDQELRRRGQRVLRCDLDHQPQQRAWSTRTDTQEPTYVRCDVADFRQLARILEGVDLVYHCAAEFGRWNGEDYYEQLWRTNAIGTKHLLRLQEQLGFRMVFFSSSEVYGDWPEVMTETVPTEHAIQQLNDYAMSKWVNEQQVRNSVTQHGTETVVVRLFNTYGPYEYYSPYRSVNCRFLYCALHGLPWVVYRGHRRTSTYILDTVRTLANIAATFIPGDVYNIGGETEHSIEELSDVVLEVTGAARSLVHFADREILTTTRKLVDTSKAVQVLGHRSTVDLMTGMQATAEWMRAIYGKG